MVWDRICSGRFLADGQLFILAATVLKVFDILPEPGSSTVKLAYEDLFTFGVER